MIAVVFGSNSRGACIQYASSPSAAIERGCSIGANHAQNYRLTSWEPKARAANARFRIIRAGFDKRSTRAFPKADYRLDIRDAAFPCSNIDQVRCVCFDRLARRRNINEDAFALDHRSRLLYGPGTCRAGAIRL
jgi:hypothetical protein